MLTDYVVIDLEMTGLNAKTDRILEAGDGYFFGDHQSKTQAAGKGSFTYRHYK